jgi:CxxC motif-containing protein (DUF1111 family)
MDPDNDGVEHEFTEGQLTAFAVYAALQQVPVRGPAPVTEARAVQGENLFVQIGCANCHVPVLTMDQPTWFEQPDLTGGRPFAIDLTRDVQAPRLTPQRDKRVPVELFSDLKRHEMGAALADNHTTAGIPVTVWLTRPLWGVAATAPYMHDGRAATLSAAIGLHGGEASAAASAFANLASDDQLKLLEFLATLSRDPNALDD